MPMQSNLYENIRIRRTSSPATGVSDDNNNKYFYYCKCKFIRQENQSF